MFLSNENRSIRCVYIQLIVFYFFQKFKNNKTMYTFLKNQFFYSKLSCYVSLYLFFIMKLLQSSDGLLYFKNKTIQIIFMFLHVSSNKVKSFQNVSTKLQYFQFPSNFFYYIFI